MQWQVILAKAVWKRERYSEVSRICYSVLLVAGDLESVNEAHAQYNIVLMSLQTT